LFLPDFDRKLAAMGFDLSDEQASDDVKKGQQKSSSESSGEEKQTQTSIFFQSKHILVISIIYQISAKHFVLIHQDKAITTK
jgi:hypothetical protein